MARANQGGSILGFLIIGSVLTVLLLGGAYFVQQRATPLGVQTNNNDEKTEVKPAEEAPKQDESQKEAPKAAPQPTDPSTTELPQTGPAESASTLLGLGLLTATTFAYIRSRRRHATL